MGLSLADARVMTFHEYTATLAIWNARHVDAGKGAPVEPPDPERVRRDLAELNANPALTG